MGDQTTDYVRRPALNGSAARILAAEPFLAYDFGDAHPLTPRRLTIALDLLRECGLLQDGDRIDVPAATDAELQLIHSPAYVEALARLSLWAPLTDGLLEAEARRYGLDAGDNPVFPGAHAAAAAIAGGSLHAARAIMGGEIVHAFHPMGGLHHAQPAHASGFCLYNDAAVAIADIVQRHEARILYVDFDVHHGDGVQHCFRDDPRVLTVSFHESGAFLFPGTGDVLELGEGAGRGSCANVPFAPNTTDQSWIAALEALLPGLAERFRPDLIVSQHGCDTHVWDPLADLRLTTASFEAQAGLLHRLAHEHCAGRWLALGGGGYDVYRVVPRSWALLWSVMTDRPLPEMVPASWRMRWQRESPHPLPERMLDDPKMVPADAAAAGATQQNRQILERARHLHLTAPQRLSHPLPALLPAATSAAVPGVVRLLGTMPDSRSSTLDTPGGPLLLRDWCPPSLIERLHPDDGLVAFTRDPVREQALLARAAAHPDTCLTVAHTPEGVLVGQVTICAPEGRWAALEAVLELALETSRTRRHRGLASHLLAFALDSPWVEHVILVAEGYWWHWDTEGAGLDVFGYRAMLTALLGKAGFEVQVTDEPDIMSSPANVLLARIGHRVPAERVAAFRARLITHRSL